VLRQKRKLEISDLTKVPRGRFIHHSNSRTTTDHTMTSPQSSHKQQHQPTHYETLQISPKATQDEIKQAYRSLVIRHHPDKNVIESDAAASSSVGVTQRFSLVDIDDDDDDEVDAGGAAQDIDAPIQKSNKPKTLIDQHNSKTQQLDTAGDELVESFHQIQIAYNTLRDPEKRHYYDQSLQRNIEKSRQLHSSAIEVNLSEMESDVCQVLYSDTDEPTEEGAEEGIDQLVYFHSCRCGHVFEVMQDELIGDEKRVWKCEGCSLAIRINVDIDIL
jgi:DnaJ-domain-containing protein 1